MREVRRTAARTWGQLNHLVPVLKNWVGVVIFGSLAYLSYQEDPKMFYIAIGLVVMALIVTVNALAMTRREFRQHRT